MYDRPTRYDEVELEDAAILEELSRARSRALVRESVVQLVWSGLVVVAILALFALVTSRSGPDESLPPDQSEPPPSPALVPEIAGGVDGLVTPDPTAASTDLPPSSVASEGLLAGLTTPKSGPDVTAALRQSYTGSATWLCDPPRYPRCTRGYPEGAMVAARGSELPRSWQGKLVRVSSRGRSVVVRLVDTCACRGDRIIDLYRGAFRRLAGPGPDPGVLRVSVALVGRPLAAATLPPTDTR